MIQTGQRELLGGKEQNSDTEGTKGHTPVALS